MPLVVGTAGHIDHGKTALVRALTGQETDRLAEEQARGISIDLGFAYLDLPGLERVGIVDVPGHERFIRNMLAGAHGMDLVLFTVAADDGVMPQTEEHLDILHLLGVRRGVFVITKTDLVDAARIRAVRDEIDILTLDSTLAGMPVVPVSTLTGEGLDGLRAAIAAELARSSPPPTPGYFRLPVDRAFVMHGHGVVVTGTAVAGEVRSGDTVRILPRGTTARVRGLEAHGTTVPGAGRGQRIAVNLAGVDRADLRRGDVVVDPRLTLATDRFDAWVEVRPGARRSLRHQGRVRVHVGTAEVLGKVIMLDGRAELPPRSSTWVQLALAQPVVALRGDRFILRDETARWTLGGGEVVLPFAARHRRRDDVLLERLGVLRTGDLRIAGRVLLDLLPGFALATEVLAEALGRPGDAVTAALAEVSDVVAIPDARAPESYTTKARLEQLEGHLRAAVARAHAAEPLAPGVDMESLRTRLPWDVAPKVFRWVVERLVAAGHLVREESLVREPSHRVALDEEARGLGDRIVRLLAEGRFTPPDVRQLEAATGVERRQLLDVLRVLEGEGRVARIAPDLYYAADVTAAAQGLLREHCRRHGEITAGAFRDLIGASRKFAIGFLDWCDRTGFTVRVGDLRRLRR